MNATRDDGSPMPDAGAPSGPAWSWSASWVAALVFSLAYLSFAYVSINGYVQDATIVTYTQVAFQEGAYAISAAAAIYAASITQARHRWAWGLLASASIIAGLGFMVTVAFQGSLALGPFQFGQFLFVNAARLAGLFLLLPSRLRYERKTGVVIDALVAAGSLFAILWILLLGAVFEAAQTNFLGRLTTLLFPSLGITVLTIVLVAFSWTPQRVSSPLRYLLAAWSIAAVVAPVYSSWTLQGHPWAPYLGLGMVVVGHSLQTLGSLRVARRPVDEVQLPLKRLRWTAYFPYVPAVVSIPIAATHYEEAVSPVVFATGTMIVVLLFVRLLLIQRENARINKDLAESAAFKTEMLRFISHEIAGPVAPLAIQRFLLAQAEQGGALDEQEQKNLAVFSRSINRLQSLSRDVRVLAQLDVGVLPMERAEHDLVEETRKAVNAARPLAEARRLTLNFLAPTTPARAFIDAERYGQVVDNLVSNAIKFTRPGGRIDVAILAEGARWVLVVEDTGVGLSPEQRKTLFTAFGRAHGQTAPGLGLGLVISKAIVDGHGGTISVESQGPNRGTQFRATFPALPTGAPEPPHDVRTRE